MLRIVWRLHHPRGGSAEWSRHPGNARHFMDCLCTIYAATVCISVSIAGWGGLGSPGDGLVLAMTRSKTEAHCRVDTVER